MASLEWPGLVQESCRKFKTSQIFVTVAWSAVSALSNTGGNMERKQVPFIKN